jgi:hypothetical protein
MSRAFAAAALGAGESPWRIAALPGVLGSESSPPRMEIFGEDFPGWTWRTTAST